MMRTGALAEISYGIESTSRGMACSSPLATRLIDPLAGPEWDSLALAHPDHSVFHTSTWAKVLCETYGHKPFYLSLSEEGGLVALVPLLEVRSAFTGCRAVCLPFSDFCEPLLFGGSQARHIIDSMARVARERNWRYFEIRGGKTFQPSGTQAAAFYGHKLDLTIGSEMLFDRFHSRVRGAIRKAETNGLVVEAGSSREAMLDFFRLHVRTRRRHGVPPQPLSFFLRIHEKIIETGGGVVVRARRGARLVAAAVFFYSGKTAIYKFAASDERMQEFRGNNLVLWEGIRFLARRGTETLHLGRTPLGNNGLRQFKLSWAAEEEMIEYVRFDAASEKGIPPRVGGSGFHTAIFSKLPLPLNRMIGALVYPHLD